MWPCDGGAPFHSAEKWANSSKYGWPANLLNLQYPGVAHPWMGAELQFRSFESAWGQKTKFSDTHLIHVFFAFAYHGDEQPHTN